MKIVAFGEIMGRICMPSALKFIQALPGPADITFAGAEANVAASVSLFGAEAGFITALHPSDSIVVAPMPVTKNHIKGSQQPDGGKVCSAIDSDIRMPNQYELSAMFYNRLLLGSITGYYWSSSLEFYDGRTTAYLFSLNIGYSTLHHERTESAQIWCIKR